MRTGNQISSLYAKLDEFIRKYYKNRLIKGAILTIGGLLLAFLAAALLEHFGRLGTTFRAFLFYGYLLFALGVIAVYIAVPLSKLWRMGKTLSREEASAMIGAHFPDIQDKLLNTLQLEKQYEQSSQNELLMASISQRIEALRPFSFTTAIDLRKNSKYARYAAVPLVLFLVILLFQSNIITRSTERIVNYNQQFAQEAPFKFNLKNKSLDVVRNDNLLIELQMTGEVLPDEVFAVIDGNTVKMDKSDKTHFSYELRNVQQNHDLHFTAGNFNSNSHNIKVLPNPLLLKFETYLRYPAYTGRQPEMLNNTGDLTIPAGTVVEWQLKTRDVEQVTFVFDGTPVIATASDETAKFSRRFVSNSNYLLQLGNRFVKSKDSIRYSIDVIPDRYPDISLETKKDSLNPSMVYFFGNISDDYGLKRLQFHYRYTASENKSKVNGMSLASPVPIGSGTDQTFYHQVNLNNLGIEPGDELEYFFEVWDNDAVNGSKASRSAIIKYAAPTEKEMSEQAEKSSASMKNKMEEAMREASQIQKRSQEIQKELIENKGLDWEDKKKIQDLLNEQKALEKKLDELKQQNQEKKLQEQPKEVNEELLEKQKQIDKLFEELMTPEMKEMFKKLEEMLKQNNKEGLQEQLDKMKQGDKDLQKQLDRALEQFKQLELEKKINEQADALEKLAKKQEELAKKTEEKSASQEELKQEQQQIEDKFEEIKKELEDIQKKNEALENPMDLKQDEQEKQEQEVGNEMNESQENLDKKQNKKAGQNQKKAAEKMEEMSSKMKENLQQEQEKQQEEDYYTLRQILENLVELSDRQESLMQQMKQMEGYNPRYVELSRMQRKLKEESKMVEDSLLALSKRQIQIQSFVNKEIGRINDNMDESISNFADRSIHQGIVRQQYVMTGMNNLAVMLSESLKQMQEQMQQQKDQKPGDKSCKNPGGKKPKPGEKGKPTVGSMKSLQEQLKKTLENMQKGKQEGKSPNSEAFAKMAAQQEAIRRQLEALEKQLKEEGKSGKLGDLNKTKELMEQQEKDLVNKQLTPEMLRRVQEIETRMLEHEKAEREQEQDNKREAEQAKTPERSVPPAIQEYLKQKAKEQELLRTLPPDLTPYYKERVRDYFRQIGK